MFDDTDFPSDATLTLRALRQEDLETPRPDQLVTDVSGDIHTQSTTSPAQLATDLSRDTLAQPNATLDITEMPSTSLSKMADQKKKAIQQPDKAGSAQSDPRVAEAAMLRMRCSQLGVSVFFHKQAPVRSLGFTSPIHGEGKSFLALLTAEVMAHENNVPVTLLECNWEHPCFAETFNLFQYPQTDREKEVFNTIPPPAIQQRSVYQGKPNTSSDFAPGSGFGLAEWLQGKCSREAMRYTVSRNLTIIPAGDGKQDAVNLLHQFREEGPLSVLAHPEEVLIMDLPSAATTSYGQLAAGLAESLVMVVRMGVTSHAMVSEACTCLKDLPVQGIILNNIESHVPGWLRQLW